MTALSIITVDAGKLLAPMPSMPERCLKGFWADTFSIALSGAPCLLPLPGASAYRLARRMWKRRAKRAFIARRVVWGGERMACGFYSEDRFKRKRVGQAGKM